MAKNLHLNIDDDVSRALRKLSAESADSIVLIVPKEALIFSNPANLVLLKKQADLMGKHVALMTMDQKGQRFALEHGIELRTFESMRHTGPSMDMGRPRGTRDLSPRTRAPAPRHPQARPSVSSMLSAPEIYPMPFEDRPSQVIPEAVKPENIAVAGAYQENFEKLISQQPSRRKGKGRTNRVLLVATFLGLIFLLILTLVILPQANIIVYARTQSFSRDLPIVIDKNTKQSNLQQLVLPGQVLDSNQSLTKQYTTTSFVNLGTKATGKIQIYNFTGKTLKLGAGTTSLAVGSRTYHFNSDVAGIKPTQYLSNKDVNPSSLVAPVAVTADGGGEDANLPSGTRLEIHNQVLGSVPELYATVQDSISGGTSDLKPVISQQDLDNAQKDLTTSMFDAAKQQLMNSKSETILMSGANVQVTSVTFDHKAGDQVTAFNATIKGHIQALAYNPSSLQSMVEQRISLTLAQNQYLVTGNKETIKADFKSGTLDLSAGSGTLLAHIDGYIAPRLDVSGIKGAITGKNALEVKEYLLSNQDIDATDISFSPFWVRTVPAFSGRVYVQQQLNITK